MSVLHFRGNFIKQNDTSVYYHYYPEFITAKEVVGIFKINLEGWHWEIVKKSDFGSHIIMPSDERVVKALTEKIKKFFEEQGKFPLEVFFVA